MRTLVSLAWPNFFMTVAQSSTGLVESWYLSQVGTDALAGSALVMPLFTLMQNMSQGAMGGGISAAIASALGACRREEADGLVLHAVVISGALGLLFSIVLLVFNASLFGAMGAERGALYAARTYPNKRSLRIAFQD